MQMTELKEDGVRSSEESRELRRFRRLTRMPLGPFLRRFSGRIRWGGELRPKTIMKQLRCNCALMFFIGPPAVPSLVRLKRFKLWFDSAIFCLLLLFQLCGWTFCSPCFFLGGGVLKPFIQNSIYLQRGLSTTWKHETTLKNRVLLSAIWLYPIKLLWLTISKTFEKVMCISRYEVSNANSLTHTAKKHPISGKNKLKSTSLSAHHISLVTGFKVSAHLSGVSWVMDTLYLVGFYGLLFSWPSHVCSVNTRWGPV